jgi:hypothetical protein
VFVVSTAIEACYQLAFHGLGRDTMADPNDFSSFKPGSWWAAMFWGGQQRFAPGKRLLVPMDARTTASPTGIDHYVHYDSGGWSWSVPWIAGLYALACQIDPAITPERFWARSAPYRENNPHQERFTRIGRSCGPANKAAASRRTPNAGAAAMRAVNREAFADLLANAGVKVTVGRGGRIDGCL